MNDEHSRADDDVAYQLAQLLKESALQKRAERQQMEREHAALPASSMWARFWGWWRDYGGSFSTLVAILSIAVGALWTVNQFLVQQREQVAQRQREVELQRHSSIAQFAADLADPTKRNAAAYAVAVLAREDAIPLLRQHLIESAASSADASFRDALVQAFLTVGASALPVVVDLNREAAAGSLSDSSRLVLVRATSSYLAAVLSGRVRGISADTLLFAGSHLNRVRLADRELDSLNLSKVRVTDSNLCRASLRHATLTGAMFFDTDLNGVDMSGSKLHRAYFSGGNDLHSIRLDGSEGDTVSFLEARMELSSLRNAVLRHANFSDADLESANLSNAILSDGRFIRTTLFQANLSSARLEGSDFRGADLEGADFSNADLTRATLVDDGYDGPYIPIPVDDLTSRSFFTRGGAYVVNANFDGVKGLDEGTRIYLCRWGALNVPGGCAGVAAEREIPAVRRWRGPVPENLPEGFNISEVTALTELRICS